MAKHFRCQCGFVLLGVFLGCFYRHRPRQRSRTRCRGLLGYNIFVVVVEGLGSAAVRKRYQNSLQLGSRQMKCDVSS